MCRICFVICPPLYDIILSISSILFCICFVAPLLHVQNAATLVVMGLSSLDHVGPALRELHWLPLVHHIRLKVALLMYMAHNHLCHLYISEVLAPVSSTSTHRQLRSSGSSNYTIPRTRTKLGDRAFSVAGPVIWNSVPESIV